MPRGRPRQEADVWERALPRAESLLPLYLAGRRWFGGKGRRITRARIADRASLRGAPNALLTIAEVTFADRGRERYFLPLAVGLGDEPDDERPAPIVRYGATSVRDGFEDEAFCRALLAAVARRAEVPTERGGAFVFEPHGIAVSAVDDPRAARVQVVGAEQSNTAVVYDGALILKAYRRLQPGPHPEVETLRFLADQTGFDRVPALAGRIEYRARDGTTASVGILQRFVPNVGDGWSWTLRELASWPTTAPGSGAPPDAQPYLAAVAELGRVTAGLHLALASATAGELAPRPIEPADVRGWHEATAARLDTALGRLRALPNGLPEDAPALANEVLAAEGRLRAAIGGLEALLERELTPSTRRPPPPRRRIVKTRLHGDYHLGQVLKTADSFVVIDFEGEPLRPLAERRAPHTPLKDVAGMLRSFTYARHAAERGERGERRAESDRPSLPSLVSPLSSWEGLARRAFLEAYLLEGRAGGAAFLPRADDAVRRTLAALELDKALYELEYELDNRPDWLAIPLSSLAGR